MTRQDEYLIGAGIVDELIEAMFRVPEPDESSAPEYARNAYGAPEAA